MTPRRRDGAAVDERRAARARQRGAEQLFDNQKTRGWARRAAHGHADYPGPASGAARSRRRSTPIATTTRACASSTPRTSSCRCSSEWGVPATLAILGLAACALLRILRRSRADAGAHRRFPRRARGGGARAVRLRARAPRRRVSHRDDSRRRRRHRVAAGAPARQTAQARRPQRWWCRWWRRGGGARRRGGRDCRTRSTPTTAGSSRRPAGGLDAGSLQSGDCAPPRRRLLELIAARDGARARAGDGDAPSQPRVAAASGELAGAPYGGAPAARGWTVRRKRRSSIASRIANAAWRPIVHELTALARRRRGARGSADRARPARAGAGCSTPSADAKRGRRWRRGARSTLRTSASRHWCGG